MVATTADIAQSLRFDGVNSLAETPNFQLATQAFQNENAPTFFMDVAEVRGVLGEEETAVLAPIHTIAANNNIVDDIILNRIYLFMR